MDHDDFFVQRRKLLIGLLATGAMLGTARPSWAAVGKLSDYDLARELYRYAFPLIFFGRYRHNSLTNVDTLTRLRAVVNQWSHSIQTVTPESTGQGQTDTLYSILMGDLSKRPLLLTIPKMDGRYWSIQCADFFGSTYAMINRRNTTGPTTIALVGPDWRGKLPKHVSAVHRSPMPWTFAAMRTHFVSDSDLETMIGLRAGFTAAPFLSPSASAARSANMIVPAERADDPLADFKLLAAMWQECPPPRADARLLRRFSKLGFGPGAKPDISALSLEMQAVLAKAEADDFAQIVAATQSPLRAPTTNGWNSPSPELGLYRDKNYVFRASIAQQGIIATPTTENVYMGLKRMPDGSLLNGSGRYEVTFDPVSLTEAGAFWSMHAYRLSTFTVVPNPIDRYSIGSRSEGLHFNADGSLTIYIQSSDPGGGRSANWLPVKPGENFLLTTRAYEPKGAIARLEWPGPKVVKTS